MSSQLSETDRLARYKPDFQEFGKNPDIDIVFHATSYDKLGGIETGLQPFREIEDTLDIDALIDDARPDFIKSLGISRLGAVYAHTHLEVIDWLNKKRPESRVGIAVAVNPQETYVFDAMHLKSLIWSMEEAVRHGERPADVPSIIERAQEYWNGGVRLDDFKRLYKAQFDENGASYERFDNELLYYPWAMIYPEVLVTGPVEPSRLQWVISGSKAR